MMRVGATDRRICRGNLKPAPFAITPHVVARVLDVAAHNTRVVAVPVLAVELVDRPRRSDDPRLAKANEDCLSSAETNTADAREIIGGGQVLSQPETAPVFIGVDMATGPDKSVEFIVHPNGRHEILSSEPAPCAGIGSRPGDGETPHRGNSLTFETEVSSNHANQPAQCGTRSEGSRPDSARPDQRERQGPADCGSRTPSRFSGSDGTARFDRSVRSSRAPSGGGIEGFDRLAAIRAAAAKINARPAASSVPARLPIGKVQPHIPPPIPALPVLARRALLEAATAFLKARCVLVEPVDRRALVRKYRMSGRLDALFAEEVIEHARAKGFGA